jgi:hypothetical protein
MESQYQLDLQSATAPGWESCVQLSLIPIRVSYAGLPHYGPDKGSRWFIGSQIRGPACEPLQADRVEPWNLVVAHIHQRRVKGQMRLNLKLKRERPSPLPPLVDNALPPVRQDAVASVAGIGPDVRLGQIGFPLEH